MTLPPPALLLIVPAIFITTAVINCAGYARNGSAPMYLARANDPWGPSTKLNQPHQPLRTKRGVVHLYNMVVCATGCNPLAYKGYGCYCGFLGSGLPMDPIDRCCKMHDGCYQWADCPLFLEYFVPYSWTCYRQRPLCGTFKKTVVYRHDRYIITYKKGGGASCGQRLCECDRRLAECLSQYPCPNTKAVCTSSPWRLLQNLIMLR